MDIRGTTVLITGASRGIGAALAEALVKRNCTVIDWSRSKPLPGSHVIHHDVDVTDGNAVKRAAEQLPSPLHILINNAGVMRRGGIVDMSEEDFDALVGVNVKGSWLVLKHVLPRLDPHGIVVQLSSRHALWLPDNPAVYGLTKQWAGSMAELVARAHPDLSVKTLCLGPVDTELSRHGVSKEELVHKEKIMRKPMEIAEEIVQLLETPEKKRLMYNPTTNLHEQE